ncbi:MAG: peptidoglycan -binding protein [Inquilinus sp.]|nr:peptidoglycan -binding protein [Inquilinus sp.]
MFATSRRSSTRGLNIWPGFVDALAALLTVVIFVLMVFMVAQFYLSNALSGREEMVERLGRQITELNQLLGLERAENADLRVGYAQLSAELQGLIGEREALAEELGALRAEQRSLSEQLAEALAARRELEGEIGRIDGELADAYRTIDADRETIELRLREIASLQADIQALRAVRGNLEVQIAALTLAMEAAEAEAERLGVSLDEAQSLQALLERQLAESRAETETAVAALELRQRDLDALTAALEAAVAERDAMAATLAGRAATIEELEAALAAARVEAEAVVATLELRQSDLDRLTATLEAAEAERTTLTATLAERDATIEELGAALAASRVAAAEAVASLELSQADLDRLTAALEAARGEQVQLLTSIEDREADLAALRLQLAALEAERSGLAATLAAAAAAGDDLADRLRLSDAEILQLRDLLASRELAIGELTAERDAAAAARDEAGAERDRLLAEAEGLSVTLRLTEEERDRLLAELTGLRDRAQALETELSSAAERTTLAQRQIDEKDIRIDELVAALGTTEAALDEQTRLSTQSQALVAQLNVQIEQLRQQLARVEAALTESEAKVGDRDVEIADLNSRLNQALVRRVEELSRYRSEFFGRLREVIGRRDDIRVVGDRFVFQSEVLFPSGSARLQAGGKEQLARFAGTLLEIARDIPGEVDWILRVDGHTDKVPVGPRAGFASNWELSTGRATEVVQYLIDQGIPANRLAAAGFGEFQPLDPADTPAALRRNRRIELKLDQR